MFSAKEILVTSIQVLFAHRISKAGTSWHLIWK